MSTRTVTLTSESVVNVTPVEAFERFGRADARSWLFRAHCHEVAPGYAVSLDLPGTQGAAVLGHFRSVQPARSIVIEHDQPWRGQIRLRFDACGPSRTRVRVRAEVPVEGAQWLAQHRGASVPFPAPTGARRLGVLTSKSGSGAIYAAAAEYMAEVAVTELNLSGGVARKPVELLVADDATDHLQARRETLKLIEAGCQAIFACVTSASFASAAETAAAHDVLMVHPVINEGGMQADKAIRFGERPAAQLSALSAAVESSVSGNRWFMVGQRYSWSFGAHHAAAKVLDRAGSHVVAQRYTPLGTRDFSGIIDSIQASGADVVMSSLVGADEVAFQQQAHASGLHKAAARVSLVMDECTLEHVGPQAGQGIWAALSYFQDVAGEHHHVANAYRDSFGPWAPPVSSFSVSMYEAVSQYLRIASGHPDDGAAAIARAWRNTGSGVSQERDLSKQRLYLALSGADGLKVYDRAG